MRWSENIANLRYPAILGGWLDHLNLLIAKDLSSKVPSQVTVVKYTSKVELVCSTYLHTSHYELGIAPLHCSVCTRDVKSRISPAAKRVVHLRSPKLLDPCPYTPKIGCRCPIGYGHWVSRWKSGAVVQRRAQPPSRTWSQGQCAHWCRPPAHSTRSGSSVLAGSFGWRSCWSWGYPQIIQVD